jgi:glutamate transport system permease protein
MSSVLTEQLGPRGQRRVQVATWASLALLLAAAAFTVYRFQTRGELAADLWEPFTVWSNWRFLLEGLVGTLRAALTAMVLAVTAGFLMALGRLSRNGAVRWASRSYVELFRSIPLLLAIFAAFFGLPALGLDVSRFVALVVALTVYNSAVLAEIFRAGVLSLDRGQTEAAQAIGLRYWPMMRLIILPQAVRRMIPAIVAQLATVTKDTSLGFVIGYTEFLRQGQSISQAFPYPDGTPKPSNELQTYIVVAAVYWVVIYLMSRLARRLEVQQRRKLGAGKVEVGGGLEDIEALGEEADEDAVAADQAVDELEYNKRTGGGGW